MSRKKLLIITLIIFILLGVFGFLYVKTKNQAGNGTAPISFRNLFPFGGNTTNVPTNTETGGTNTEVGGTTPLEQTPASAIPRLRQISSVATAGGVAFDTTRTEIIPVGVPPIEGDSGGDPGSVTIAPPPIVKIIPVTAIEYLESETAHVYRTYTDMLATSRISNTTIPRIHDALWSATGMNTILRYLNEDTQKIETYLGVLTPPPVVETLPISESTPLVLPNSDSTPFTLEGTFLPQDIIDISLSPDKTRYFYITKIHGSVIGTISDFDGTKNTQPWSSPFTEWLSEWATPTTITLTTKPSAAVPGYAYTLSTTGVMEKVLGKIMGLTVKLSPDGKTLLYGASGSGSYKLLEFEIQTGTTTDLGIRTLPEKCVWERSGLLAYCAVPQTFPQGSYPDDWYQGKIAFGDALWRLNLATGVFDTLYDPKDAGSGLFDMTNLFLDPQQKYIFFTNRNDSTLWSYRIIE